MIPLFIVAKLACILLVLSNMYLLLLTIWSSFCAVDDGFSVCCSWFNGSLLLLLKGDVDGVPLSPKAC